MGYCLLIFKQSKLLNDKNLNPTAAPETPFPSTEPVRHSRAHLPTSTRRRSALLLTPNLRRTDKLFFFVEDREGRLWVVAWYLS
ncbi:hypothetical protein DEO72_LG9g2162 [Vigna unguiculata]|uniref:Uncharacterized protein n=1 Tax=Vigna unguiculata TaxID=3917 RepID=A0A4D6N074_VIGUN|nr:hypothetical protein DEO72_LG9g2162 [Vigna unguiculata]